VLRIGLSILRQGKLGERVQEEDSVLSYEL